jgi:HEAT repeat protein
LLAAADDADKRIRFLAIWLLWQRVSPAWIGAALSDGRARVRRVAATFAGRIRLADAQPKLTMLLADADPQVRNAAARAIALLGSGIADAGAVGGWLVFTMPPRNEQR